jgi:hypothetical protein
MVTGRDATPASIRAALARLREASRALARRPPRAALASLARLLDEWRDPGSPRRRELEAALPAATGFSPETVRAGLAVSLEPLSGEALERVARRELGGMRALEGRGALHICGFETTAVLLAGALPTPTLLDLLLPLALGSGVLAKPSRHDPVTPRVLAGALADLDPELAACLALAPFGSDGAGCLDAFLEADCVVATGSDQTVAEVARRLRPPRRLLPRGHRLSVAALGPAATRGRALESAAEGLARDVALWDQLGCLSPLAVLVCDRPGGAARVAEALAAALDAAEARWPRGRVPEAARAAFAREHEEAEFRAAAGRPVRVLGGRGSPFTVVLEEDARPRPAPLHRFLRVQPCRDGADLIESLRPLAPWLAGVALAGFGRARPELARALARLGASRVCAVGRLQQPPLAWHHEGVALLLPLARLCDLELTGLRA